MAWGRLEDTFYDEPKFFRASELLGISFVSVAGHMAVLWSWAHRHAPDGDLRDFDVPDIERAAKWDGESGVFVDVLLSERVNLLDRSSDGFRLHRFLERAEARKAAKKKAKQRVSLNTTTSQSGQSRDSPKNVPEEKRREEKRKRGDIIIPEPESEPTPIAQIRRAFLDGYAARYPLTKRYPWGAREGGQARNWLKSVTLEEALELVRWFFPWKRPDVIKAGHPFCTGSNSLVMRYVELRADIAHPERRAFAAEVQERERIDTQRAGIGDQAKQLTSIIAEKYANRQDTRVSNQDNANQQRLPSASDERHGIDVLGGDSDAMHRTRT